MYVSVGLRIMRHLLRRRKLLVEDVSFESSPTQECKMSLRSVEQQLQLSLTIHARSPHYGPVLRRLPLQASGIVLLNELLQPGTQLTVYEIQMHFQPWLGTSRR